MKNLETSPFEVAKHLDSPEMIRAFLQDAAALDDEEYFIHALNTAAKAMGMSKVAKKAGLTRASLYKSLNGKSKPKYSTINKVTKAMGMRLSVI